MNFTLDEVSSQQTLSLSNYLSIATKQNDNMAERISTISNDANLSESTQILSEYLLAQNAVNSLGKTYILLNDNTVISDDATESINISNFSAPQTPISDFATSPFSNNSVIFFTSPITSSSGEQLGNVITETSCDTITSFLQTSFVDTGITMVLDSKLTVVATTQNDDGVVSGTSVEEIFDKATFSKGMELEELMSLLLSETNEDFLSYSIDGKTRNFVLNKIESTDWFLVVSVPDTMLTSTVNYVLINAALLVFELVVIFLITWRRMIALDKRYLKELTKTAYYDDLTGLMNEKKFKIEAEKLINSNKRIPFAVIKIDVVNFKVVNKLFGFHIGNEIIKAMATTSVLKAEKTLFAHANADTFLLLAPAHELINLKKIKSTYETEVNRLINDACGKEFKFRFSRYLIPPDDTDIEDILDTASLTHSLGKTNSPDGIYDYTKTIKEQVIHTAFICDSMHQALEDKEFKVYLQPKINLSDGTIYGAEALVRWQMSNGKFIFPNEFIPVFEQEGFIVELDKYMLRGVCEILSNFMKTGQKLIPISVNFSRLQMLDETFADTLTNIVDEYKIPHKYIEIEMTETSMIDNSNAFKDLFENLHNRGFELSMDDFGAGYSSLSLLSELNFDVLKIDKSLLDEVVHDAKAQFVIHTIINMSKNLNLLTVCEGIETIEQVNFLKNAGCNIAQGYYYAKPMPLSDFENFLRTH